MPRRVKGKAEEPGRDVSNSVRPGQCRGCERVVGDGKGNGGNQVRSQTGLDHKTVYAGIKTQGQHVRVFMHGKENDFGPAPRFYDLPDGLDAFQDRHGDVGHHHPGPQLFGCPYGAAAIGQDSCHFDFRLQGAFEGLQKQRVSVGEQRFCAARFVTPSDIKFPDPQR